MADPEQTQPQGRRESYFDDFQTAEKEKG